MAKRMVDLIKLAFPLNKDKRKALDLAGRYLDEEDMSVLKHYLKIDRCFAVIESFKTSQELFDDVEWPHFKSHLQGKELHEFLDRVNNNVAQQTKLEAFLAFGPGALDRIAGAIAPNIVGLADEKLASAIQLFAKDPLHVLMIGDPGTGKTDILRSLEKIAPISSFGLGSGVSGVGLSASVKGDQIMKGLLPLADGGIACIDELNLIKAKDLAALYNAMEKGFVSYDKGSKHETLSAKVRVCATANPVHGEFVGKTAEIIRKQIPFGNPLLSRFHMIFTVRKPSDKEFEQITKKIVSDEKTELSSNDIDFLQEYVKHASSIDVKLDGAFEVEVVGFIQKLKKDEKKFLQEVGPRTVVGLVRLVKAIARAELSQNVKKKHLDIASKLYERTLWRKNDE